MVLLENLWLVCLEQVEGVVKFAYKIRTSTVWHICDMWQLFLILALGLYILCATN